MQTIDYEKQAQDFLDKHGIKFRATLSDSKVAPWAENNHFRVTLSKHGKDCFCMYCGRPSRLTFDFWGSIADAEKQSALTEKLQALEQRQMDMEPPNAQEDWRSEISAAKRAITEMHPTPYDVLACISGDVHAPETFKDYCSEFGESADSIKALQTFRRVAAFAKRLREFFTAEEIEELPEIQ